jgi:hypothetical protein
MYSKNTLHEYQLLYPHTAEIPTLVQSGMIGLLLEEQQRKAFRKARRRARFQRAYKRLFA